MESESDNPSTSADPKGQRTHPSIHHNVLSACHCTQHLLSATGVRAGVSALGVSYNFTVTLVTIVSAMEEMLPTPNAMRCCTLLNQS